jgi:type VI secretion system protein ImpC
MPPTFSFGKIELTADTKQPSTHNAPQADTPFCIALLGDFSNRGAKLSQRPPILIDRDNFDDVLAQLKVQLQLPPGVASSESVTLQFNDLEDFHPDRIFEHVEAFQLLDDLRRRLKNPATFEAAAAEMRALIDTPAASSMAQQPVPAPNPPQVNASELLDQIIDASPGQKPAVRPDEILGDWQGFLRRLVAPHLVPQAHPQAQQLIAHIETAMSEQMRAILHPQKSVKVNVFGHTSC